MVRLEAFDQQAGGNVGRMIDAATGSLLRRPLVCRLDAADKILLVEDVEALIDLIASAI